MLEIREKNPQTIKLPPAPSTLDDLEENGVACEIGDMNGSDDDYVIVFAGPTGQGKTTTLAKILKVPAESLPAGQGTNGVNNSLLPIIAYKKCDSGNSNTPKRVIYIDMPAFQIFSSSK